LISNHIHLLSSCYILSHTVQHLFRCFLGVPSRVWCCNISVSALTLVMCISYQIHITTVEPPTIMSLEVSSGFAHITAIDEPAVCSLMSSSPDALATQMPVGLDT
jgi:hypothetical protein